MHFNIYLDDHTGQQLRLLAQQAGQSRNALIRQAIRAWLAQQAQPQWPTAVANFEGMADMPAFEASRKHMQAPALDPLA